MRKNLFKKAGAAVLGLVLAGSLLAGCGSGSPATQQGADEPQAEAVEEQAEEAVEESADAGYRTLEQIQADGKINIGVFSDRHRVCIHGGGGQE